MKTDRRHRRNATIFAAVALVAGLGYLVSLTPGRGIDVRRLEPTVAFDAVQPPHPRSVRPEAVPDPLPDIPSADPVAEPEEYARQQDEIRTRKILVPIEAAIDEGRFERAITMLNHVRPYLQHRPEPYLLMGRALHRSGDTHTAIDFFLAAIERDPGYAEAYFEFAAATESAGDLESALGGMRSFIHLSQDKDPYRLQIAQARSAIWEIEARLGRGAWGATRGIPPGFTEEELKRDGKGVGIKMPIPGTERPDGTADYEIKSADKQEMFRK